MDRRDRKRPTTPTRRVRLFRSGRNQVLRIPREFEKAADEVILYREDHRLVMEPVERLSALAEVLAGWAPLDEEFPGIDDPPVKPEAHL